MIHNGGKLPSTVSTTISNLATGLPYKFYVVAENVIGQSVPSSVTTVYSCTEPYGLARPIKGAVTMTSVQLFWEAPYDNGGCLTASYSILRNDGLSEVFIVVQSAQVNNDPTLNTFIVTDLPANPVGMLVKFKVSVKNVAGYSFTSFSTAIIIAGPPSTPANAPASDFTTTSST